MDSMINGNAIALSFQVYGKQKSCWLLILVYRLVDLNLSISKGLVKHTGKSNRLLVGRKDSVGR
jgi:hypothetical protein